MTKVQKWIRDSWDEAAVYAFTVVCAFFGDYILHKTRPDVGWLPFLSALVVAGLVCLAVEVLTGNADTDEKKAAKKRGLPKRMLISALAGLASSAVVPVMVKTFMASIGIEV